jgi:uncharacterized protein YbjT (DUF2867 family)
MGADVVQGNLQDKESLIKALRGTDGFFVMTTPFGKRFGTLDLAEEVAQGKTALEVASEVGTPHVVLTSVASADRHTGIPHFETKATIEDYFHDLKIPGTVVRPTSFMDGYASPWIAQALKACVLSVPTKPGTKIQMVATRDIGEFVARAFGKPGECLGQTVELAGDSKSMEEVASLLSQSTGRRVVYAEMSDEQARKMFGEDGFKMNRWFDREGFRVDIPSLEPRWGLRMTTFDEFLGEQDWRSILGGAN